MTIPVGSSNESTATAATDTRFSCNICFEPVVEPVVTYCGHLYCWPCLYRWLEPGMSAIEQNDVFGFLVAAATRTSLDRSRRSCPVCKATCTVKNVVPVYVRSHHNTPTHPISSSQQTTETTTETETTTNRQNDHLILQQDRVESPMTVEESESESDHHQQQQQQQTSEQTSIDQMNNDEIDSALQQQPEVGLRRRHQASQQQASDSIPTRPQYSPTAAALANAENTDNMSSFSNTTTRGGISHGLAVSLQEAFFQGHSIPSLHNPTFDEQIEDATATRFLSRLLLMLGSFVILCLLLF